jgi:hypothetical protein
VFLASNDGRVLVGDASAIPAGMLTRMQEGRGRGVPPMPSTPPFLVTSSGPDKYWVGRDAESSGRLA